jgi:DNA-binding transcriptional regulator YiaG
MSTTSKTARKAAKSSSSAARTKVEKSPLRSAAKPVSRPSRARAASYGALLVQAMGEAVAIDRGKLTPARVDEAPLTAREAIAAPVPTYDGASVSRLRERLRLSQGVFAAALNVSTKLVQGWEQGLRRPDGAAARLLEITERDPSWVAASLRDRVRRG